MDWPVPLVVGREQSWARCRNVNMGFASEIPLLQTFPAGTWAWLESRAEASCCHVWSTSCQPRTLSRTATLFSCVNEEGERRAAQDLNGYLLLCFDFSYRSSCFSLMAFFFIPRDFFLVSAAGDLSVSVGWVLQSPPALEILPRLQYYFPSILLCAQQDTDPFFWTVMLFPLVYTMGN